MIAAIDFTGDEVALVDADRARTVSYAELGALVEKLRDRLRLLPRPALAFQFCPNSVGAVAAYLACLAEKIPLGLAEPAVELRSRVMAAYRPTMLVLPVGDAAPEEYERMSELPDEGIVCWRRREGAYPVKPHPDLALLLATSGSTGDAKFVRLSLENLQANAESIACYLELHPGENAAQGLPFHYSYGLSVLNSHLVAHGAVTIVGSSFMRPEFWAAVDRHRCTSFAGVPYMYETLQRLAVNPFGRPSLRTLTQAGGHLRLEVVTRFHRWANEAAGRMFVMYGQTEATARIAYVPADRLAEKMGTIGVAIPGGELWLEPVAEDPALQELHYRGANVMLGYAQGPADLALGDEMGGDLATGDLAESDAEGFFRLTGRLARLAKLFGKRVNLASIEQEVERHFSLRTAAVENGDGLKLFLEMADEAQAGRVRAHLSSLLGVTPVALKPVLIDRLPLTASGKKNYKALR
jgi:acyl-CoA synthetase (AMP-forming)/AMP-acid ligase II